MRTPVDNLDYLGSIAGAYDDAAQRWLDWGDPGPDAKTCDWFFAINDANREHMHEHLDRSAERSHLDGLQCQHLIALDRAHGRYAGAVQLFGECYVSGWLAPHFRGQRLGADLFAASAKLAHLHLGVKELVAVAAEENIAALSALRVAGFEDVPPTLEVEGLKPGALALCHRAWFTRTC